MGDRATEAKRVREAYGRRAREGLDERYSLLDRRNLYLYQRRERALVGLLVRQGIAPLSGRTILDVGCGSGEMLGSMLRYGADPEHLHGMDLLPDRVAAARRRYSSIDVAVGDAAALAFPDASFDIALQFTLLSSVLDETVRLRIAAETVRVLRPGGLIIWYDFIWNPLNRDARGIGLGEIRQLYSGCSIEARRVTLAPPISRRIAPVSWTLCRLLEAVPFLRSHHLAAIRKGASQGRKTPVL